MGELGREGIINHFHYVCESVGLFWAVRGFEGGGEELCECVRECVLSIKFIKHYNRVFVVPHLYYHCMQHMQQISSRATLR